MKRNVLIQMGLTWLGALLLMALCFSLYYEVQLKHISAEASPQAITLLDKYAIENSPVMPDYYRMLWIALASTVVYIFFAVIETRRYLRRYQC